MSEYCLVNDVQKILPENVVIGTNLQSANVRVLQGDVEYWIQIAADIIDSHIGTIYRAPLIKYKEPDFSTNPVTFTEKYPPPIVIINARLAASHIYDEIIMSDQEPGVSDWGKNQRALAFDDLKSIESGVIILKGQVLTGRRFARQELLDNQRVTIQPALQPQNRQPGL